jgi:hypothetical protein
VLSFKLFKLHVYFHTEGMNMAKKSISSLFTLSVSKLHARRDYKQTKFGECLLPFGPETSRLLSRYVKVKIYKTIILPVVLYGCETWSLTLREEHRLRVFENMGLRRIFGPKRDEVTGEWRKLDNEELHILYSSPNIIRQIKSRRTRWVGHVASMGEGRNVYKVLTVNPEGGRPLGRPRRRWEDGIRLDRKEIGWGSVV